MKRLVMILFSGIFLLFGQVIYAEDDPSIQGETREESQKAMSKHISENSYQNKYIIYDAVTGKLLNLDFKELHSGIVKKGDFYVSCADFMDTNGNQYDLDFLVGKKDGEYKNPESLP